MQHSYCKDLGYEKKPWTIFSRSQEMLSELNLEQVALTFVVASTRTRALREASAPGLGPARWPFSAPLPFSTSLLLLLLLF